VNGVKSGQRVSRDMRVLEEPWVRSAHDKGRVVLQWAHSGEKEEGRRKQTNVGVAQKTDKCGGEGGQCGALLE
jgi:hypothetical protein